MGGDSQPFLDTTGTAFRMQDFVPRVGVIDANLELYGAQGRFQPGTNYLELKGAPWLGGYWTVDAGDFRQPGVLVEFPFTNIFNPEIDARGAQVRAQFGNTQYALFWGEETLTGGTRVAYRIPTPQQIMGASLLRSFGKNFHVAMRATEFSASRQAILGNPNLFPAGRDASLARTVALQSLYTPAKNVKLYAEASQPFSSGAANVTSYLAGAAFDSQRLSWKINYVSEGILYLPLAGYFAGDRRGPFAEARFRPWRRMEVYGSASKYENNLEHNAGLPVLDSHTQSAGLTAWLIADISISAAISDVFFTETAPGQTPAASANRQLDAVLTKSIKRQTWHVEAREIRLETTAGPQTQRSWEAGDNYQGRHFSVGGAVRYQQIYGVSSYNSLFFRGMAQSNWGPLSAYANFEIGNDLANRTVFSTEAYTTSVFGLGLRLSHTWNFQAEVFRNRLNVAMNPENIFLMQSAALSGISPTAQTLTALGEWSLYFRLSKQLRFGAGLPAENPDRPGIAAAPLTGEVEGQVLARALEGASPVEGITILLDRGRKAVTGRNGFFRFDNVGEGLHEVALSLDELAADYDPGTTAKTSVKVMPKRGARADFDVLPLASISGRVTSTDEAPRQGAAPPQDKAPQNKVPLDGMVIRMSPGTRYAITSEDGSFVFHNVHEGDYQLTLDKTSLPENGEVKSAEAAFVTARAGKAVEPVRFEINIRGVAAKPIKKVLDKK